MALHRALEPRTVKRLINLHSVLGCTLITLPWLNPFVFGPSTATPSWILSLGVAGVVVWLMTTVKQGSGLKWDCSIATAWLLAAAISSCIALLQYFHAAKGLQPWVSPSDGVAFANLRQRNQFASLTLIGFAALLWLCQTMVTRWATWVVVAASMLLIAGNAASASRTGLIGLCLIVVWVWLWRKSSAAMARRLACLALPLYAAFSMLLPALTGHPGDFGAMTRLAEGDSLCGSRLTLWSNVLHLIAQKPWFGWGWGELDYAHYVTLYADPRFCDILDNAHNLPLHLAVELGLPCAVLFCGAVVGLVLRAKPWAETHATRQMVWSVLTVIGLHSLLEYPLWYGPFQLTVLLCVMLLRRVPHSSTTENKHEHTLKGTFLPVFIRFLATLLIVFSIYMAWDYHRISQIYLPLQTRSAAYRNDTLNKISGSWLFHAQVQFAELSTTPLTQANAAEQYRMALALLHFSPEARVVERVIESALVLHLDKEVAFHMVRYQAAFPQAYATWVKQQR